MAKNKNIGLWLVAGAAAIYFISKGMPTVTPEPAAVTVPIPPQVPGTLNLTIPQPTILNNNLNQALPQPVPIIVNVQPQPAQVPVAQTTQSVPIIKETAATGTPEITTAQAAAVQPAGEPTGVILTNAGFSVNTNDAELLMMQNGDYPGAKVGLVRIREMGGMQ